MQQMIKIITECKCAICLEIIKNPHTGINCHHNFCELCICDLKLCPTCKKPLNEIKKNHMVSNIIESFTDFKTKCNDCNENLDINNVLAHIDNCECKLIKCELCKQNI